MSAFTVSILQAITMGIGLAIGYFFNKASLKLWRVFVGLLVGFAVSWFSGAILLAFVLMPNDPNSVILTGMPKSFMFAILGGGMGVYFGRRNAKLQKPNPADNTDATRYNRADSVASTLGIIHIKYIIIIIQALRVLVGLIAVWQVLGLLPVLSLFSNLQALDVGIWIAVATKTFVMILCGGIYFWLGKVKNRIDNSGKAALEVRIIIVITLALIALGIALSIIIPVLSEREKKLRA